MAKVRITYRLAPTALVLAVLVGINTVTFWPHYFGEATFPWDFLGGYHFQSFGWFTQDSIFTPAQWFPWGDMGFPSALAIQSGSWYLPLGLLAAVDIPYTVQAASAVQAAHVLVSAIGLYFLLRRFQFSVTIALLGAVAWHFSGGLYSNGQHVDIVRAYALLPWLFWVLHPDTLLKNRAAPVIAALIIFQFFIAAYPGAIATAGYACITYMAVALWSHVERHDQLRYVLTCAACAIVALCLAMIKWLPYVSSPEIMTYDGVPASPFYLHHFLTVLWPYEQDFLSSDLSMRSLFVPAGLLLGVFFMGAPRFSGRVGLAFVALAIVLGSILTTLSPFERYLPGLNVSRFPLADWRGILQIGLILLACEGWSNALTGQFNRRSVFLRLGLIVAFLVVATLYAWGLGYSWKHSRRVLAWVVLSLIVMGVLLGRNQSVSSRAKAFTTALIPTLILISIANGYTYHDRQARTWSVPWSPGIERKMFGATIDEYMASAPQHAPDARPARFTVGEGPEEIALESLSSQYNRCWYAREYCLLGYNNLRHSIPHQHLRKTMQDPETGAPLIRFMQQPSTLLIWPAASDLDFLTLVETDDYTTYRPASTRATTTRYGADRVQYEISTPEPIRVIENEVWWPGWSVQLCNAETCLDPVAVDPTQHYLRSWSVPTGTWTATLRFEQPGARLARAVAGLGLVALLIYCGAMLAAYASRKRRQRQDKATS